MAVKLFADGGSRGNPGPAACGWFIERDPMIQGSKFLGKQTNNYAEYMGLIFGLEEALKNNLLEIEIYLDSELVVKQILGEYKVKNENIKPLHTQAKQLLNQFKTWSIGHVRREKNTQADQLVNQCLDQYQNSSTN